jgi:two-component system nitrate/nitrite response regulator NarL
MKQCIRVLVVDDHPVVRKGILSSLADQPEVTVVGEAGDGQQAVQKAKELKPDIIVMDVEMPRMSGLMAAEMLRRELPDIRILMLSMHRNPEFVMRIIQSGARGYLLKDSATTELMQAILTVHAGETFFSDDVARTALNQFVRGTSDEPGPAASELTGREREVLIQIAEGLSNKEIATLLNVGVRTIETHRERIMRKLSIHSIAGLTRFAIAKGFVSVRPEPSLPADAGRPAMVKA